MDQTYRAKSVASWTGVRGGEENVGETCDEKNTSSENREEIGRARGEKVQRDDTAFLASDMAKTTGDYGWNSSRGPRDEERDGKTTHRATGKRRATHVGTNNNGQTTDSAPTADARAQRNDNEYRDIVATVTPVDGYNLHGL